METFKAVWGDTGAFESGPTLSVRALDKWLVTSALKKTENNQTQAAKLLGLTRDQLRYRIAKHGLRRGRAA